MRSLQPRHKDESFAFLDSTTQADNSLHSNSQKKKTIMCRIPNCILRALHPATGNALI